MYIFFAVNYAKIWGEFLTNCLTTFGTVSQMYLNAYKYPRPTQFLIKFLGGAVAMLAIYLMFGPL